MGIRLRFARGNMGREEGKIAIIFSSFSSHETAHVPQPNPQSFLIPKNTYGYESVTQVQQVSIRLYSEFVTDMSWTNCPHVNTETMIITVIHSNYF